MLRYQVCRYAFLVNAVTNHCEFMSSPDNKRAVAMIIAMLITATIAAIGHSIMYHGSTGYTMRILQEAPASNTAVVASAARFDQGQAINTSNVIYGGDEPYTYNWLVEVPGSNFYVQAPQSICTVSSGGNVVIPEGRDNITEACDFATNSLTGTGKYSFILNVTDSASSPYTATLGPANIVLESAPALYLTTKSRVVGIGQTTNITARVEGGAGPFNIIFYTNGTAAYLAGNVPYNGTANFTFTPTAPGNYVFTATATDTGTEYPFEFNSAPLPLSTYGQFTGANILVAVYPANIDVPQNTVFNALVDGVTMPSYGYTWLFDGNVIGTNSTDLIFHANASTVGYDTVSVVVTDSFGQNATGSNNVQVNGRLGSPYAAILLPQNTIYLGDSENAVAYMTGGTPPYSYSNWRIVYGTGEYSFTYPINGTANTVSIKGNFSDQGLGVIEVNVTDSTGEEITVTNTINITYSPATNDLVIAPNTIDGAQNTLLSEYFTTGNFLNEEGTMQDALSNQKYGGPLFNVSFYNTGTSALIGNSIASLVAGDNYTLYFSAAMPYHPAGTGDFTLNAVVAYLGSDLTYAASTNTLVVYNPLGINASPSSQSITEGGNAVYTADVSGGSGNFSYQWYNYTGPVPVRIEGADANTLVVSGSSQGTFTYYAYVIDNGAESGNDAASANVLLTVNGKGTGGTGGGGGGSGGGGGGGGTFKPTVTQNGSCYYISNFTQDSQESIDLNSSSFGVVENYITPTGAGIDINGVAYFVGEGGMVQIGSTAGYNYTMRLVNFSYAPILHTVDISICSSQRQAAAPVPPVQNVTANSETHTGTDIGSPASGSQVTLSIGSNGTITAIGPAGHVIAIVANGNVVDEGDGIATYNGYGLLPGNYTVVGRDTYTMIDSQAENFTRPRSEAVLELVRRCTNTAAGTGGPCTVTASIYANGSMLNASLYVNGNYVGSTDTVINSTMTAPGNYVYVFSTRGNSYFAPATASYTYTLPASAQDPAQVPAVAAIVVAICSSATLGMVIRHK